MWSVMAYFLILNSPCLILTPTHTPLEKIYIFRKIVQNILFKPLSASHIFRNNRQDVVHKTG